MHQYAGEFRDTENKPSVPMVFDGWGFVPLKPVDRSPETGKSSDSASEKAFADAA